MSLLGGCPKCGFTNETGSKFCGACGLSLATYQASGPGSVQTTLQQAVLEGRFYAVLPEVTAFLQRHRRVTYQRLNAIFSLNDAMLNALRQELTFQQVARDEDGLGLV